MIRGWILFFVALFIALYVYVRINRYEYLPNGDVFDRWTTKLDRPRHTKQHFVAEPMSEIGH